MRRILTISVVVLLFAACNNTEDKKAIQGKVDDLTIKINKLEQKKEALIVTLDTVVAEKIYLVKTEELQPQTVDRTLNFTANLLPWEEIYMAPAAPGRVQTINVEVGDKVHKGDLLAKMDETQLTQAKIQLAQLQVDFERMKALRESNSISAQQFDQLKTQLEVTKSNVQFLQDNTKIVAPFDGVITGKYFENGEMYSGAPNTPAGKAAIVTIQQMDVLKAVVNVSENYFPEVKLGISLSVLSDIYPDVVFNGKIDLIYPTIDPLSRAFKVEVKVANAARKLRPGMYARVDLKMGEVSTLVVPAIAVLQQEGTNKRYVFVNKNGVAKRIDVQIGERFNENIEVLPGELMAGDELIVVGQAVLMDGYKVKVTL